METATNAAPDTAGVVDRSSETTPVEPELLPVDGLISFTNEIEKVRQAMENKTDFYEVSVSTMQYEASSDVTWYFDKGFSPLYFKDNWAMEEP